MDVSGRLWAPPSFGTKVKAQEDEERIKLLKPSVMENLPANLKLTPTEVSSLELDLKQALVLISLNKWIHEASCNIVAYLSSPEEKEGATPERTLESLQALLLYQKDFLPCLENKVSNWA